MFWGDLMKIGLVLSGGGARGAYQVGVWKAIKELGLDVHITNFSGTSIGGLNSVLFSSTSIETTIDTWKSITPDIVLQKDEKLLRKFKASVSDSNKNIISSYLNGILNFANVGVYSRKALKNLINDIVDFDLLRGHNIYLATSYYNPYYYKHSLILAPKRINQVFRQDFEGEYFNIKDLEREDIVKLMLATSAIPFIFPPVKYHKELYVDGGLMDNVPYKPLLENHDLDALIIIDVMGNLFTKRDIEIPYIDIIFRGIPRDILSFKNKSINKKIEKGYQLAMKVFKDKKITDITSFEKYISSMVKK